MASRIARPVSLLFLVLALYFAVNIIVRLSLPASLELDEAEQVFFSQWLALGYGPQPPLYNWLQIGTFALVGRSLLGLSLLKNALLFSTYLLSWLAARQVLRDRSLQIIAVLGLLTLPQVSFMAEQDLAHTVALIAATALFLYALCRILVRPDIFAYLIAGLAVALGVLAKYNFVLLPVAALLAVLPERDLRDRIWNWRLLIALLLAFVLVLPHAIWLIRHLDFATAETLGKMKDHHKTSPGLVSSIRGVASLAVAFLAFSALTLVIFTGVYRRQAWTVLTASSPTIRIIERMLLILLAALLLVIIGTGTVMVRERWLDPFLLILPLYLCLKIEAVDAANRLKHPGLLAIPLIILIAVPASIALRVLMAPSGGYTRLNIPTDRFVESVVSEPKIAPAVVIAGDRRLAGNIALLLPGVPAMTPQHPDFTLSFSASATRPLLLAWSMPGDGEMPEALRQWLAANGYADARIDARSLALPYHFAHNQDSYAFGYAWISPTAK